ncbi:MAG: Gluconolactonase [Frankiales bacterium]|nr:Gluconolactonase [Frankiales bacterium]
MSQGEVLATGLPIGEGPVELPDGTLAMTGVADGWIWRVDPQSGRTERWADVAGSANSAVVTSDGGLLVAQNGGLDLSMMLDHQPPVRPVDAGLQRVRPDGSVSWFVTGLLAPNDTVVAQDGTLWLTDPPPYPPTGEVRGRVLTVQPDGAWEIWADDFAYCNGLALEPDGSVLVCEAHGLMRLRGPGQREWLVPELPSDGDGLCLDADGNIYVAGTTEGNVRVLSPEGEVLELIGMPVQGVVTDMAFVGPDRTTLVAFLGIPGTLVVFENRPVAGAELVPFAVSA